MPLKCLPVALWFVICPGLPRPARADQARGLPEQAISDAIRSLVIETLPHPLHESSPGWGRTKRAPSRLKWEGKGLRTHPELVHREKNDGIWRKLRVEADNPADDLVVAIHNLERCRGGFRFDLFIGLDVKVFYQQQNWSAGLKLYDGTARAKLRIMAALTCEVTTRFEKPAALIPDMVLRFHIVKANVRYENFELQHVSGVGGDMARLIGRAGRNLVDEFRPSLEAKLLAKANAAIMKAADNREIRLRFSELMPR